MKEIFKTWYKPLETILTSSYFNKLIQHLESQYNMSRFEYNKIKIYPKKKEVFKCFNCDFEKLKVVIIGNEPFGEYSGGLALDTNIEQIRLHPASEVVRFNIEHEFYNGFNLVHDFTMESLMEQGVLLLNSSLTVTSQKSHHVIWKEFMTYVINVIQERYTGMIFCVQKDNILLDLIDVRNNHLLVFDDPEDYVYNPLGWGFKFQTINNIIKNANGEAYEIEF